MVTDKYQLVNLELSNRAGTGVDVALDTLNRRFNPDDFQVVRNGSSLEIWLRQMDVAALSDAVSEIAARYGNAEYMHAILQAVMDVRSYGINGNKRLYVGLQQRA